MQATMKYKLDILTGNTKMHYKLKKEKSAKKLTEPGINKVNFEPISPVSPSIIDQINLL